MRQRRKASKASQNFSGKQTMPLLLGLCPGPSPGELKYIFILKTFLLSAMTSSKDKGESKEKSTLHYFPSLFEEQRTSMARVSVLPCSIYAPSHLSPPEDFPSSWGSHNLPQGKRSLLYNKWQALNKQYGQTQIPTMIVNVFSSVVDSNVLISSCLPAWGSLQLWKAKHSAGRKRVSSSASYLWSKDWNCCSQVHCSIKCCPQTTELSNHQPQLAARAFTHFRTTHPQPAGLLEGTAHPAVSHRCQDLQRAFPWHCCQCVTIEHQLPPCLDLPALILG